MISEVVTLILSFGPHTMVASAVLSSVKSITLFLSSEVLMSLLPLKQEPKSQQLPRDHSQNGSELWGQPLSHPFCEQCCPAQACVFALIFSTSLPCGVHSSLTAIDDWHWAHYCLKPPHQWGFHPLPYINNNPTAPFQNSPCPLPFLYSLYYYLTYFKATYLRTHLPELDVYSMSTRVSAGLFTEALLGLEWVHTVGVKLKPPHRVKWDQSWLQRTKSSFHFNIAGVLDEP